jgi:hypothetical protein
MSSQVSQVQVVLTTTEDGQDRVAITLEGPHGSTLALTPSQARALATDLITAVNRAEVKANLKVSPNLWRRSGESRPHLLAAG